MEIGQRIRELRAAHAMSQDDLAARVYVSRQTISSWENGKTYPDVQSLLLLSEIFDATVDSLIKGDVETMTETIDRDAQTMKRLSYVMTVFNRHDASRDGSRRVSRLRRSRPCARPARLTEPSDSQARRRGTS